MIGCSIWISLNRKTFSALPMTVGRRNGMNSRIKSKNLRIRLRYWIKSNEVNV